MDEREKNEDKGIEKEKEYEKGKEEEDAAFLL